MIEIPLTQNQIALIDDEDFELVSAYKWCAAWFPNAKIFYAVTNIRKLDGKWTTLKMHRIIMNAKPGELVDHIHHLTLDNRKAELRLCTRSQNGQNSHKYANNRSGHKGVYWRNDCQKWMAQIWLNGKRKNLGLFATPELAHEAYCKAAYELHGSFARVA